MLTTIIILDLMLIRSCAAAHHFDLRYVCDGCAQNCSMHVSPEVANSYRRCCRFREASPKGSCFGLLETLPHLAGLLRYPFQGIPPTNIVRRGVLGVTILLERRTPLWDGTAGRLSGLASHLSLTVPPRVF